MIKIAQFVLLVLILPVVLCGAAFAEEQLGVKVYPGAKSDGGTKAYCDVFKNVRIAGAAASMACFRTADPFDKVVEFYVKQSGLKLAPQQKGGQKNARFCPGDIMTCASAGGTLEVSILSPWQTPSSGQKSQTDVLITIRKVNK
jgi:hypothetical protein